MTGPEDKRLVGKRIKKRERVPEPLRDLGTTLAALDCLPLDAREK